ncbi:HlyD family efflux transporter periplasmic adaptor subunit [Catenuloplanes indicus]|uniref:Multidrug efflux pump subunit AcrA (Membrane-fusion protein) n=1 Tax=Catenuloplanes indicus TaxID=137267 RepID=A0AAE3VWB2_9ACTN|nr:HlyD family efflux transporter periplasmic adaptor subunit [Catenuloplanes indicus]MDQ0365001.1 multidrug efflux pump subunit AcrA (membrane-fusion protein) [Catenuloplanes indicus]
MRRRLLLGAGGLLAVAAGAGVRAVAASSAGPALAPVFSGTTAEIVRGDLRGSTAVAGTLRFTGARTIHAARSGVLTELPAPGTVITLGKPLYAVDNAPVVLLRGRKPAWRDFRIGMDDGPDVRQLEESLRTLGLLHHAPDNEFGWPTADALEKWRDAATLPLDTIMFAEEDLRVGTVTARPGDRVAPGTPLFEATGTTRVVDADVPLADQRLAVTGTEVGLALPGGRTSKGRISSVGTPTERPDAKKTIIPVVVTLADPAAAGDLQQASVTVDLPSEHRTDVLSVPVGALLAIDPQRFGVEVVGADGATRTVPVTTGLFAAGRVEISGDGIAAGQRVVVPGR